MQTITRIGTFDAGHRLVNHPGKCGHLHGHTYKYELMIGFGKVEEVGYAIDFADIKRLYQGWVEEVFDHGMILNPRDTELVTMVNRNGWKLWPMSLKEYDFLNPTVENIAKEIFCGVDDLILRTSKGLTLMRARVWETPNCYTDCGPQSLTDKERILFSHLHGGEYEEWIDKANN